MLIAVIAALTVASWRAAPQDADEREVTIAIHHPDQLRHALMRLHQAGIGVEQVELRFPTLDGVFLELTKAAA